MINVLCACSAPAEVCGPWGTTCRACYDEFEQMRLKCRDQISEVLTEKERTAAKKWAADIEQYEAKRDAFAQALSGFMVQISRINSREARMARMDELCKGLSAEQQGALRSCVLSAEVVRTNRELKSLRAKCQSEEQTLRKLQIEAQEVRAHARGAPAPKTAEDFEQSLLKAQQAWADTGAGGAAPWRAYGVPIEDPRTPAQRRVYTGELSVPADVVVEATRRHRKMPTPPRDCVYCSSDKLDHDTSRLVSKCAGCGAELDWRK